MLGRDGQAPPGLGRSYLPILRERSGEQLEAILDSYGIDMETLEGNQFGTFFVRRGREMLEWIAEAMGKRVDVDAKALRDAVKDLEDSVGSVA